MSQYPDPEEERRRLAGQQPPTLKPTGPGLIGTTTRDAARNKVKGEMGLSLSPSMLAGEAKTEKHFGMYGSGARPPRDLSLPYTKQEEARTNNHMTNTGRPPGSLAGNVPATGASTAGMTQNAARPPLDSSKLPAPFGTQTNAAGRTAGAMATGASLLGSVPIVGTAAAPAAMAGMAAAGAMANAARPTPVAGASGAGTSLVGLSAHLPAPFNLQRTGAGLTETANLQGGRQRQVAYMPTGQQALQTRFGQSWLPQPGETMEQAAARRRAMLQASPAQSPQGRVVAGGNSAPDHRGNYANPFALQTNGAYGPVNTYDPSRDHTVARVGPGQIAVNPKYATPGSSGIASVRYAPSAPVAQRRPLDSSSLPRPFGNGASKGTPYRDLGSAEVKFAKPTPNAIASFGGGAARPQQTPSFAGVAGVNPPAPFNISLPKPDFQAVKDLAAAQPVNVRVGNETTTFPRGDTEGMQNIDPSDVKRAERLTAFNNKYPNMWRKMEQYKRERRSFIDMPREERAAYRDYQAATAPLNDVVGNTARRAGEALTRFGEGSGYEGSKLDKWLRNKLKASSTESRVAIQPPAKSWPELAREYDERQRRVAGK